jgi:predicted MFS family arabinose efflux permease
MADRLFTARFLTMFGYTFTVFASVFQLLPIAPYRILALGGSTAVAGLFHGFLTYSSALSGPATGGLADRIGHRTILISVSLCLAAFSVAYAFITDYRVLLALVVPHGVAWSALLAASGAYMTATIPPSRRAEGLSYWGLATVLAIGAAPAFGFWIYRHGWFALCLELAALNLIMAAIAWMLPDDRDQARAMHASRGEPEWPRTFGEFVRSHVEWRVILFASALALIAFGYGGVTSFSALFADELGVAPRSLFLTAIALAIMFSRLALGRSLDSLGHRRVLIICLPVPAVALFMLAAAQGWWLFVIAALLFGGGFGLLHPSFTSYVLGHISPRRHGAAFGSMLAAFDTGIGSGATFFGTLIHHFGFRVAFVAAGCLAALALPCFLLIERAVGLGAEPGPDR